MSLYKYNPTALLCCGEKLTGKKQKQINKNIIFIIPMAQLTWSALKLAPSKDSMSLILNSNIFTYDPVVFWDLSFFLN